jgi:hypothetical protein
MAKKESKSKQHTRDLVGGMTSSNPQSKTPISTLYPKKVTVGSSRTAPAYMQKGTHSPSKSYRPQKFLLSVTHPGSEPTAPTAPEEVATAPVATGLAGAPRKTDYESYDTRGDRFGDEAEGEDYNETLDRWNTASESYTSYQGALSSYNTAYGVYSSDLSNYNTNLSSYNVDTSKNVTTTTKYNRDVRKFLSGLKGKATKKQARSLRGSRNTNTRLGGARG